MKNQTFEQFLMDLCFDINPTILDDDMPDYFENWLTEIEAEDYLKWGELYGRSQFLAGKEEVLIPKQ